jgi:hypothetical protein
MLPEETRVFAIVLVMLLGWSLAGCGGQAESQVDPKPFESAIAKYLEQGNMAMKVKEIKTGPTVDGQTATLTASLTHAELEGPSVTWTFTFEKTPDDTWKVTGHEK